MYKNIVKNESLSHSTPSVIKYFQINTAFSKLFVSKKNINSLNFKLQIIKTKTFLNAGSLYTIQINSIVECSNQCL
jgi:hypothetical protein